MSDNNLNMNLNAENNNNLQQDTAFSPYQQVMQQQNNYPYQQEELSPYQQFLLQKRQNEQTSPYGEENPYGTNFSQPSGNFADNEGMPQVIISPPLETMKDEILNDVKIENEQDDLNLDGHKVFVRQPVIQNNDSDYDLVVNEPTDSGSIFSAPTPVYDPNAKEDEATPLNVQPTSEKNKDEQNQEASQPTNFINSMKNFYSALGEENQVEGQEINAPNVSNEPLPAFTSNTDIFANDVEQMNTVENPVQSNNDVGINSGINNFEQNEQQPKDFMLSQSPNLESPKKNEGQIQQDFQNQVENQQQGINNQASFLTGMMQNANNIQPNGVQNTAQDIPFQRAPVQNQQTQNYQPVKNPTQQNSQVEDDQYWTYMNNLLERFDHGEVHNEATDSPVKQEVTNNTNNVNPSQVSDEKVLEQFGQTIDKPEEDNVITKAFKKAHDDLSEDNSAFEESFNVNMDSVLPKKKEKKKKTKKIKQPSQNVQSVDGSLGESFFTKENKEKSKKRLKILGIVAAALIVVVFFGVFFGKKGINSSNNKKYKELISTAKSADADWKTIKGKNPGVSFPQGIQKKYTDLYALNNDFVGWISIKGLKIDLPVVQNDNYKYYLNHNFKKKKSGYGTTFMQSDNSVASLSKNTIIYGESMKTDKQMFTKLKEYKELEGYKKAPVIEFNTLYKDYKWKVFAVFITNANPEQDNGYLFKFNFTELPWQDDEQYAELFDKYIHSCRERSLYNTGVDVKSSDKLLTLTTTSNEFKGARIVVVARMVRDGESPEVPLSLVKENKSPRYPQAWYDKKHETNNYKKDTWDPNSLAN